MQTLLNAQRQDPKQPKQPSKGDWFSSLRADALASYDSFGAPSPKLEAWLHTSLKKMQRINFDSKQVAVNAATTTKRLESSSLKDAAARLVFVNGRLVSWMISAEDLGGKLTLRGLQAALTEEDPTVQTHLGSVAPQSGPEHALTALNTARFEDGALVVLKKGASIALPIELIFIAAAGEKTPSESFVRNLIVLEDSSDLTVVERYLSLDREGKISATNAVTEVVLGQGARVRHLRLQDEAMNSYHLGVLSVQQARDSRLESSVLQLGAALGRVDLQIALRGPGASCSLDGLYVASGNQHMDQHTLIHHIAPHCDSVQLYKGVLDGKSTGIFRGEVQIHEGAIKSTTAQVNRNLALSNTATVYTKPQLEIDNDDVAATHGATIGQLDGEALFYLTSRGIDLATARSLLTWGFAREVVERLPVQALHESLTEKLAERLSVAPKQEGIR